MIARDPEALRGIVLEFIRTYWARHGRGATRREIAAGLGRSVSTVQNAIDALVHAKRLTVDPFRWRSLRVVAAPPAAPAPTG